MMDRSKTVAVIGLGRVGSIIAASLLRNGFFVYGVDKDRSKLESIKRERGLYWDEPKVDQVLIKAYKEGRLVLTVNGEEASKFSRVKLVSIPIPLKGRDPDFTNFKNAIKELSKGIKRGDLVSIESSVPPGTTRYIALPIMEAISGLQGEKDFYLVYSPERIYQGRGLADLEENYLKVVAGLGPKSLEEGVKFYSKIAKKGVITLSKLEAAEVEKLAEGIYRDVNIALANELALACEALGVDFWEVRKAANLQPVCHIHLPGTGVGGNCIPIYPYYLLSVVKKLKMEVVEAARKRNEMMPKMIARLLDEFITYKRLRVNKIAVLGLAFRGDVDDDRNSPTYELIKELKELGYDFLIHDPFIKKPSKKVKVYSDLERVLKNCEIAIIATDHSYYRSLSYDEIKKMAGKDIYIFDARGVLDRRMFQEGRLRIIGVPPKLEIAHIPID